MSEEENISSSANNSKIDLTIDKLKTQKKEEILTTSKNKNQEISGFSIISIIKTKEKIFSNKLSQKCPRLFKCYQKLKKYKLELLEFILILISILFYKLSLQGCYDDESNCLKNIGVEWFMMLIKYGAISAISLSIALSLISYCYVYFFHLIYVVIIFVIFLIRDHGTTLDSHGFYNAIFYFPMLFLIYLIMLFIFFIGKLIYHKKYVKLIIIIFSILFLVIFLRIQIEKMSVCTDWELGFNNTKIENRNNVDRCFIEFPKKCYLNLFDKKFNLNPWIGYDCKKRSTNEKKKFLDFIKENENTYTNSNTEVFGFPIIDEENYPQAKEEGTEKLSRKIFKDIIDMNDYEKFKKSNNRKYPEIILNFTEDSNDKEMKYGKYKINLKYNETLANERKAVAKKNNQTLFENVLLIFLDTLSRRQVFRKLPKLVSWLEKFFPYKTDEELKAYQLLKYHSLGTYTHINVKPILYGYEMVVKKGESLVKVFKEKGYITGHTIDICYTEFFSLGGKDFQKGIEFMQTDHNLFSIYCDPNYHDHKYPYPIHRGAYASTRRCLYGKDTYEYLIDYTKQFFEKYKDSRKFFKFGSQQSHEGTGEVIGYMDEPLTNMLDYLYKNGLLKDTAIFIFSDHGNHMAGHVELLKPDDLDIEKVMPIFVMILPREKEKKKEFEKLYQALEYNQQVFISPYDIHDTLIHIVEGNCDKCLSKKLSIKGQSLFSQIDAFQRTCHSFLEIAKISGYYGCSCKDHW